MNRLLVPILVLLLTIPIGLRAQLDPVSLALRAYQSKDYTKAQELIDIAITDEKFNSSARTWCFRGYIYKDLYKIDRLSPEGREQRSNAIESFQKTMEIDTEKEFENDCIQSLKFLGSTLFNDAATALDKSEFEAAQSYYDDYKSLTLVTNPNMDFSARDVEFKLYKASKLSVICERAEPEADLEVVGAGIIELYKEVIEIDSNNVSANYNLGIHYYNQGVNMIDIMDYELPFEELFMVQERVMELFIMALPYMLKAYKLDPSRTATLEGLSGIYFGLNDIEKSEFYQQKLDEIQSNQ
jgi:tetratricopeptide (TPR) repeat protein